MENKKFKINDLRVSEITITIGLVLTDDDYADIELRFCRIPIGIIEKNLEIYGVYLDKKQYYGIYSY